MRAISTDLSFVDTNCPPGVYRSLWDLLCNQLFANTTIGLETSGTFPNVKIWNEGTIVMTKTTSPYSFTIETDGEVAPKASDIILYKNKFYIIGSVVAGTGNLYSCLGCVTIDASILTVYVTLLNLQRISIEGENARVEAEQERAEAERQRAAAESGRQEAFEQGEENRAQSFADSEADRQSAFEHSEAERQEAEEGRQAAEGERVISENERASAENDRALAESRRARNEIVREREMAKFLSKLVLLSDVEYAELVEHGEVDPDKIYFVYEAEEE